MYQGQHARVQRFHSGLGHAFTTPNTAAARVQQIIVRSKRVVRADCKSCNAAAATGRKRRVAECWGRDLLLINARCEIMGGKLNANPATRAQGVGFVTAGPCTLKNDTIPGVGRVVQPAAWA